MNNMKGDVQLWLLLNPYLFSDRKLFRQNCLSEPFLVSNSIGICFYNKCISVDEA